MAFFHIVVLALLVECACACCGIVIWLPNHDEKISVNPEIINKNKYNTF